MLESTNGISAIYGPFLPPQRFDATPRHRRYFCRDSFGGGLSDLRSPGIVGRPDGAVVVRTCAGNRKMGFDLRHFSHARHEHATHRFRSDDV